ncbi:hypothetical protein K490DRAFT_74436 [Saccharata proteae CBS 121410]|uniref:COP9 signalosome complex subunit 6 n=1 Tax=Saccharata proteae CBS 121410 TaxID=1314787 RepID=A0A9P4LVY6_9PEZI|nr:hypothetical protein K490DRAFT_74436 [Saccharata proteae CBS 121410]
MAVPEENQLISSTRASDTSPLVQLHPLVLLTISDYITRHTLRQQKGPVVGAILGQQNGRDITMEVAFECKMIPVEDESGGAAIDEEWFNDRLEQYKTVYKAPALDIVGWFTLGATSGPSPNHLSVHEYIQKLHNETALLLLFHPNAVLEGQATGGKLPLTIYESVLEGGNSQQDKSSAMEVDGTATANKSLRFRELTYSVETSEAEMIAVDFVAKGGGNATAVDTVLETKKANAGESSSKGKGKAKVEQGQTSTAGSAELPNGDAPLLPEDEELLASLTAKTNAIKMLRARIKLLEEYLHELPPSYLTDASISFSASTSNPPDHEILRSIQSLVSRLPLLAPADTANFEREQAEQRADVELTNLLATITDSVADAHTLGTRHQIVEGLKADMKRRGPGFGPSKGLRHQTRYDIMMSNGVCQA